MPSLIILALTAAVASTLAGWLVVIRRDRQDLTRTRRVRIARHHSLTTSHIEEND